MSLEKIILEFASIGLMLFSGCISSKAISENDPVLNRSKKVIEQQHNDDRLNFRHKNVNFKADIDAEASLVLANNFRRSGGNEFSLGDFLIKSNLSLEYKKFDNSAELHFDWTPRDAVLDFADSREANFHNRHWLRADGYLSRPNVLVYITGNRRHLQWRVGGFLTSGLESLEKISLYYLNTPAPLLHTQHYDKGAELMYKFGDFDKPVIEARVSLIDGDWAIGESSVFTHHKSAANSSPSYAGHLRINPIDWFYFGTTGTIGKLGSYPGEKRRQNNLVLYAGYKKKVFTGELEIRGYGTFMQRNPEGDGSGSHVDPVESYGYGIETVFRDLIVKKSSLYLGAWKMGNKSGLADGEIWPSRGTDIAEDMSGISIGIRWDDPFGLTEKRKSYLGFQYNQLFIDKPSVFGYSGLKSESIFSLVTGMSF